MTLPPQLPDFNDLSGMTFRLQPGSPSASEAESRQWSFWDLTKCLVKYKVTHTGAGHKETFRPPDVFPLASNKADVLDFARLCVICFGFAIKELYIYPVFGHFVLVVSRRISVLSAYKSNNIWNCVSWCSFLCTEENKHGRENYFSNIMIHLFRLQISQYDQVLFLIKGKSVNTIKTISISILISAFKTYKQMNSHEAENWQTD